MATHHTTMVAAPHGTKSPTTTSHSQTSSNPTRQTTQNHPPQTTTTNNPTQTPTPQTPTHHPPPNANHPQRAYHTRPNAGPWETLRVEQIRGGIMIPQTYDYAKGPRPDGTRTWQANWEGRQTAEFGAVGEGKGIL